MKNRQKQCNPYMMVDSCGRRLGEIFYVSNLKEAYNDAKLFIEFNKCWKIKRIYNGGVRG